MNATQKAIHQRTLVAAAGFKRAEAELLECIQKADEHRVFRSLGFGSLFDYVVRALSLSENVAYNFINVARKAREVPALKRVIREGKLSVSKARKISSVLTSSNQEKWLSAAISLPQRELEACVASESPSGAVANRMRPIAADRSKLTCGISRRLEKKLRRAQDLLAQRAKSHKGLEATLEALVDCYLEKHDPEQKAKRARTAPAKRSVKPVSGKRTPIPAHIKHQLIALHGWQCHAENCSQSRHLEFHHKIPLSQGGGHSLDNLTLLCFHHHRGHHDDTVLGTRTGDRKKLNSLGGLGKMASLKRSEA